MRPVAALLRAEVAVLAVLAVLAASAAYHAAWLPNHDASWFVYIAASLQDGASFYDRFTDPNWPIAAYVMAPAAWLWRHGIGIDTAINAQTHLAAAISLLLSLCLLRGAGMAPLRQAGVLAALALAELTLPGADFGQREHLFAMLVLPYVTLVGLRLDGQGAPPAWALAVGLAAGIAATIKPLFMLLPLAVEATVLLYRRDWRSLLRPETAVLFGCGGASLILVLICFPEYVQVGSRLLGLYDAYRGPQAVRAMAELSSISLVALALTWAAKGRCPQLAVGTAAHLAGLLIYWVQMKGWAYHLLPAMILAAALPGHALAHTRNLARNTIAAILPVCLVFAWNTGRPAIAPRSLAPYVDLLSSRQGTFYALSVSVEPFFPAGPLLRKDWAGRANCLFLLPGIVRAERQAAAEHAALPAAVADARDWLRQSVAEDIAQRRPDMVLIAPQLVGARFDLLGWFEQSPEFRAAWQDYAPAGRIEGMDIFQRRP